MNKKSICFILALAISGLGAGCLTVYAQGGGLGATISETIVAQEHVSAEDLDIKEPSLLPSSPFYFFKSWGRGIRRTFTFDPVKKAELELRHADEKLAETKKLAELNPENAQALDRAMENYSVSQERLKNRLRQLQDASQNPNVEKLLEKLADRTVKHEKLFGELKEKFAAQDVLKKKLETLKDEAETTLAEGAKKDNAKAFARKLERAFLETKGSDLKHLRSLEIIDRIQSRAPTELKERLGEIRDDFSKRLKEDLEEFVAKHATSAPEVVQETLERLPGDRVKHLIIIDELRDQFEKRARQTFEEAGKIVESALKEKEEFAERAREAVERARERLDELRKELAERRKEQTPRATARLFEEAESHLQRAAKAIEERAWGEAFAQARSAEVLARNALRMLKDAQEPEDEDLKEDIAELDERLRGWEQRIAATEDEVSQKAKLILEEARMHLRLAAETLANGALREAKKHYEEAKRIERKLERFLREVFRRDQTAAPAATAPAPTSRDERREEFMPVRQPEETPSASARPRIEATFERCRELEHSLIKLKELLGVGSITKEDFERRAAIIQKELSTCLNVPQPIPPAKPAKTLETPPAATPQTVAPPVTTIATSAETPTFVELKVEADDNGFYPSSVITVAKGSRVKLHFIVRPTNVYFAGLDFRSPKFKTDSVKPGGVTSVEFTADEPFVITSYWPASGTRKADLKVEPK